MTIWKPIPNYEGLYEISDSGEVKSLHHRYKGKELLKQCVGSRGYLLVTLNKDNKQTTCNVHRLVALAFLPNPDNLPCVNHKDENKLNNSVSNLEWCSYYYNNVYGARLTKSAARRSKAVLCIETGVIYPSATVAAKKINSYQAGISSCCNGRQKTCGGYHWKFA